MKLLHKLNHNALRKGIIMRQFITITTADNSKFYVVDIKSEKLGKRRTNAKMFNVTPIARHITTISGWECVKELGKVSIAAGQDEVEAPVAKRKYTKRAVAPVAKRKYTKRAVVPEPTIDRRALNGMHKSITKLSVIELIALHGRLTKVLGSVLGSASIKVRKTRTPKVQPVDAVAVAV